MWVTISGGKMWGFTIFPRISETKLICSFLYLALLFYTINTILYILLVTDCCDSWYIFVLCPLQGIWFFFLRQVLFFFFWDRGLLSWPGWLCTRNPAPSPQVLVLQSCTITSSLRNLIFKSLLSATIPIQFKREISLKDLHSSTFKCDSHSFSIL
jgi:hypothetical protein